MVEPHDSRQEETRRLLSQGMPPAELRRLSVISPARATWSVLKTWGLVAGVMAIATHFPHPAVLVAAVFALAAQQHALAVLAHDAEVVNGVGPTWRKIYARRALPDA